MRQRFNAAGGDVGESWTHWRYLPRATTARVRRVDAPTDGPPGSAAAGPPPLRARGRHA